MRVLAKNVPYLASQAGALLHNTSTAVKAICLIVFCTYFLSFSEPAVLGLSVTPGYFNPPHFWVEFCHRWLDWRSAGWSVSFLRLVRCLLPR